MTALDTYYDGVMAVDDLLTKALRLSEVARIARLETQLRRYLLAKWNAHSKKAVETATRLAAQLKPASQIAKAVEREMDKWAEEVLPRHIETQQKIYRLARIAGWKKANKKTTASLAYSTENLTEVVGKAKEVFSEILPAFDIADERAMAVLGEHQTFWIGEHYDENIGSTIADTTKTTMVEAGKNRRVAGELIRERVTAALGVFSTPGGWHGSAAQYSEGLAANAATTARAFGQMRSFQSYGVTKYVWNAINDRRTCTRCAHLDGRVFTVEQGVGAMERELAARTPAGVKQAHPFIGGSAADMARLLSLAPTKGRGPAKESASLAGAGISMPPLHFRCFAPQVLVWTWRGLLPISHVRIGDLVLTHKLRWRRVTHLMASWHEGEMQSIDDVDSTLDHPYYVLRDGMVVFDELKKGDRVGNPKRESLGELRQLWEGISSDSVQDQDSPSMFRGLHTCEQGAGWPHLSQKQSACSEKSVGGRVCKGRADQGGMPALWENGACSAIGGEEVQVLLTKLQEQGVGQRELGMLFGMRPEVLADTCPEKTENMFIQVQAGSMEAPWKRSERRISASEGITIGQEKSDVRQIARPRAVGHLDHAMAGRDPREEFVGGAGCAGVAEPGRALSLRTTEIQALEGTHLQTGLLPTKTGHLDRGQGVEEKTGQADRATLSAQAGLDPAGRDERIEFVPVEATRTGGWRGYVWNLTVEDDESFLVGRAGRIVHNCRCTVDISTEAGSWEV